MVNAPKKKYSYPLVLINTWLYLVMIFPCFIAYHMPDLKAAKVVSILLLIISLFSFFIVLITIYQHSLLEKYKATIRKLLSNFIINPDEQIFRKSYTYYSIIVYTWFLFWWGNLFFIITKIDENPFNKADVSLLDTIYFSVITAFTIGYGDIYPTNDLTKILVIMEIFLNFIFVLLIIQKSFELKDLNEKGPPTK